MKRRARCAHPTKGKGKMRRLLGTLTTLGAALFVLAKIRKRDYSSGMDAIDRIIAEHLAEVEADLKNKAASLKSFKPGDIVVDNRLYRPVPTETQLEETGKLCPFCGCKRSRESAVSKHTFECKECGAMYGTEINWQPPRWASQGGFLRGIALLFGLGKRMEASENDVSVPNRQRRVRKSRNATKNVG